MPSMLGEKIRNRRIALNLSLEELAKRTDSSKGYLWELENRDKPNPSADKLTKLAAALDLTMEFLLEGSTVDAGQAVLDQAFFRRYQNLDQRHKEKVQKFMDIWDDED
ncbi:TPA: helix-turn-helix transcriptional regulator [Stenotrophomonas maltophilia]|uniref:helix-turn-helix domain-containing protein n=1 Tax=Stenotrophomonas TaxID=40323 RepID=UPI00066B7DB6|nr:helix-turn-helix transcriptional regulator [Stenotrophomonas maltophilia]MBH1464295.1 helix-turn-helix transcriptional regulator [Stenotrophomonas maltophilia]MBH1615094.1 helix-turn-helix transcriptional regulator [Stenotrophomonas maltophilia]MBH1698465.1 helix-turn-helix transcriptional regulator [Stenotrophomonas maltophilia]MBH1712673.1 helix-turn-helix transcriptional regulator [Stenotrophomonas maltophilia]MBN5040969.1 helix-turn-helix transcriptional regulator [Stenotrophomonas malt